MRTLLFSLSSLSRLNAQLSKLNFKIDSLSFEVIDTSLNANSSYEMLLYSNVDHLSNKKVIVIEIRDKYSNITFKRFDSETKVHLETRTVKVVNGKSYLNGPFYFHSLSENTRVSGTYKMNYLEGLSITIDSTNKIISKCFCNSKKKTCNGKEYYSNGNIKKKYKTIVSSKYYGNFNEYYISGLRKTKGKYIAYKVNNKSRESYFKKIKNYEEIGISETEGYISVKKGVWKYYNEDGSINKKENFDRYGNLF